MSEKKISNFLKTKAVFALEFGTKDKHRFKESHCFWTVFINFENFSLIRLDLCKTQNVQNVRVSVWSLAI